MTPPTLRREKKSNQMLQTKASVASYSSLTFPIPCPDRGSETKRPFLSFHPRNKRLQAYQNTLHCLSCEEDKSQALRFLRGKKLLRDFSTWGIGGPCNYFIQVFDEPQLISAIRHCYTHSIPFLLLGKGSKCLFDDRGFNGCIILNRIEFVERIGEGEYRVGSGYPFNRLGIQCSKEGFTGLEFAGGIPGTVGGAAFMNAGADGQESADTIQSVSFITMDGRRRVMSSNDDDLAFGYRMSCFQEMQDLAAITAVTFRLTPSASAMERQQACLARRKKSQPLQERSAGSVFRNPILSSEVSAAELIDEAGLKGYRVGGAKVSELHANFFINCDGWSTSRDMLRLIDYVKEKVYQRFGIELEEEIQYIPYDVR